MHPAIHRVLGVEGHHEMSRENANTLIVILLGQLRVGVGATEIVNGGAGKVKIVVPAVNIALEVFETLKKAGRRAVPDSLPSYERTLL